MYFKSLNPIDIRQYSNSDQGILDIQSNAHSKKETRGKEDGHLCLPRAGMKGHKYGNSHVYWALSQWGPAQHSPTSFLPCSQWEWLWIATIHS